MRVFHVAGDRIGVIEALPPELPDDGFVWIAFSRDELHALNSQLQAALQQWDCGTIFDLHVSDLKNAQLPSRYDYTSWYDLLVFRRLATSAADVDPSAPAASTASAQALTAIDTSPVGFAVFDRVLVTVHPPDCPVLRYFEERLGQLGSGGDQRGSARLPTSPADLMLRMVNHIVDSYLELRRILAKQLGTLEQDLLDQHKSFNDWRLVLKARETLRFLGDTCEDQRSAIQDWIDSVEEWPVGSGPTAQRERELLKVRSRDVLEHIERVLAHVNRLGASAEAAVQMHFTALGHRTSETMRTLTVLTAIFLPLNLITGIFGMNFDALPLIHRGSGAWVAFGAMAVLALALTIFFWRKRYIG